MIDKKLIRRSFNTHASTYDQAAHLQRRVAGELAERVRALHLRPARVLDIGTGTGYIPLALAALFPSAAVQACDLARSMLLVARSKQGLSGGGRQDFINADAEFLPYRPGTFDLVVSNLAYQWVDNWQCAFREVARVLGRGGVFCFTTLGSSTLCELRDAYRQSCGLQGGGSVPLLHEFIGEDTLRGILAGGEFGEVTVQRRLERQYHTDVRDLMVNLKTIGAQHAPHHRTSGLGKPRVFRGMVDIYEKRYREPLGIPATYELLFGFGRKVMQEPA